jgi:hypothetical protein
VNMAYYTVGVDCPLIEWDSGVVRPWYGYWFNSNVNNLQWQIPLPPDLPPPCDETTGAPFNLTAMATANNEITLWWQGVPSAIGYNVYRKTAGGTWAKVNGSLWNTRDTGPGVRNGFIYSDSPLTQGTEYFYHVVGVFTGGSEGAPKQRG